ASLGFIERVRGVAVRMRQYARSRVPAPRGSSEINLVTADGAQRVSERGHLATVVVTVWRSVPGFSGQQGNCGKYRPEDPGCPDHRGQGADRGSACRWAAERG